MHVLLERHTEATVVKWAKAHGWLTRKLNGLGFNHWPDHMFIGPQGRVVLIEFKKPGQAPRPAQQYMLDKLGRMQVETHWTDDAQTAIEILARSSAPIPTDRGAAGR